MLNPPLSDYCLHHTEPNTVQVQLDPALQTLH